jgi:hypothetical protein
MVLMRYQQDLQVMLRDRLRRLMTTGFETYVHEVNLIASWMNGQPAVRGVLDEIATAEADVSVAEWKSLCGTHRGLAWPTTTEPGRANLVWRYMLDLAADQPDAAWQFAHNFVSENNFNVMVRGLTEQVLAPLFDFLGERIADESSVLYLLERYVRRVEWFDRDMLYERYTANTRQGEKVYDDDLRRFLFDQGIDMPFSQPKSASGLSDVVGNLDSEDPLVCEIKLFDGGDHGKRNLASGVHQLLNYANDYTKHAAYLVVINLSGQPLELPSDDDAKRWPPYVTISGVRLHLLTVRALPTVSASKLGKAKPTVVSRDDLTDPDA